VIAHPDAHVPAREVVANRVLEQIRDQPDEKPPVARHDGGDELDVEFEPSFIDLVLAQGVPGDRGQVDRLATVDALVPLGEREQRVDQLLLLLVLLERVAAGLPERLRRGRRIGDHHFEQRPRGGQGGAQLVRGIGDESPLRVVGPLERAQHPTGDQPTQAPGDQRHDGQRDRGLDLEIVQVGDPLARAHVLDCRSAGRRRELTLDLGGHHLERRDGRTLAGRKDPARIGGHRVVRDETVGDRQEHGAASKEQPAVEQGESPAHRGLRLAQPGHRPSPMR
jgi:hypothetical protein